MNEFVNKSDSINELATALCKAQGQIKPAEKNCINPHFNSKYSDIASIFDASRHSLTSNGLSLCQIPSALGAIVSVTTILMHNSGQWISGEIRMEAKNASPQAVGSCITYARRYSLASILGIAAEEDDDGNAAQSALLPQGSYAPPPSVRPAQIHAPKPTNPVMPNDGNPHPSYVIPFGKFKGQRLSDVSADDIFSYIKYLTEASKKENKPLSPNAKDFITAANQYLNPDLTEVDLDNIPF